MVGGESLSASAVRRVACTAGIVPVVLGGKGEILDLGRTRRLFSPAQRKALQLRDAECRAEGCTIPARWCEAHHLKPWAEGGKTDLDAGILYCSTIITAPATHATTPPDSPTATPDPTAGVTYRRPARRARYAE